MTLNEKIEKALNDQINLELSSFYLYLSMAQWFHRANWRGCAHWMRLQAGEELSHAYKLVDFVGSRDAQVTLAAIKAPRAEWGSLLEAFEEAYKHEQGITRSIHEMFAAARRESDFTTESFLKWYLDEQVEEEARAQEIVRTIRMIGDVKGSLYMFDRELAQRKPPSA